MSGLRILISGVSVAGPVTAFWLAKAGAEVTVIERAKELRTGGQSIDLRGHAVDIVEKMGLLETVKANCTHEEGFRIVDTNDVVQAEFPAASNDEARVSATADIEILRGRLAQVFYEATKDRVKYVFGTRITDIEKQDSGAKVSFSNDALPTQVFDLVIGADGQSSTTRQLVMGSDEDTQCVNSLNQWTSWFSMPNVPPTDKWWRWYNAPGRRLLFIRPDDGGTRGSLSLMTHEDEMRHVLTQDPTAQKALLRELFKDAGWKAAEIIEGMDQADDFYLQEVVQIKLPKYHNYAEKRTVLVGDAGYAASPISGMGTALAIIGCYILAGEIVSSPGDLEKACESYEDRMRPFVQRVQKLLPGAPGFANPETAMGIKVLNTALSIASWPPVFKMAALFGLGNPPARAVDLPDYTF